MQAWQAREAGQGRHDKLCRTRQRRRAALGRQVKARQGSQGGRTRQAGRRLRQVKVGFARQGGPGDRQARRVGLTDRQEGQGRQVQVGTARQTCKQVK
jgi:hypothetical protein